MKLEKIVKHSRDLASPYAVTDGRRFRLKDFDPRDTGPLKAADKPRAADALRDGIDAMAELQDKLYAHDRWSLLLIFQAMDAAGKDGVIKHVMSGLNPQGCQVASFKAPSPEELDHDYLWRCQHHLPERGCIGIFNRSYYEEVLVVRVHPEILERQKLPPVVVDTKIWKRRYEDIAAFERYLGNNGTVVRKFFLNVSRKEQKRRFLERLDTPAKNWKFSVGDAKERACWKDYMAAYRGDGPADGHQRGAVVRGAGRQQVVHADRRGRCRRRRPGLAEVELPGGRARAEKGAGRRAPRPQRGGMTGQEDS